MKVHVSWMDFATALGSAVLTAALIGVVGMMAFRLLGRHWPAAATLGTVVRMPFRALLVVVAAVVGARTTPSGTRHWWGNVEHALHIALIVVVAWLVGAILVYLEDVSLRRARIDMPDNRNARRIRTQVLLMRRLTVAAVVVVTIGAVLLTFTEVRAVGASVLASAGVISVIAGLAAQSTLSNVFAGITLAFSDALRIGDAVIVEAQWGTIEELTLTYVVVRLWDDRRLILPSTYFTANPFENWTRHTSELLGAVEFDLDWRTDMRAMRDELDRILLRCELWDGRVKVLQVTDAIGGWVHVRVLVTAKDAPTLFDLRCKVREQLVGWIQHHNPEGLPRHRTELVDSKALAYSRRGGDGNSGLFTGGADAQTRAIKIGGVAPKGTEGPQERPQQDRDREPR
jgi:small-conductance mechanosensitive channel